MIDLILRFTLLGSLGLFAGLIFVGCIDGIWNFISRELGGILLKLWLTSGFIIVLFVIGAIIKFIAGLNGV